MTRPSSRLAGLIASLGIGLLMATGASLPAWAEVPVQSYEVVRAYPHDTGAFTEGLFFHDGALYESTGLYPSFIRKVDLETGAVQRQRDLPTIYFGEGMTTLNGKLYSLTWRNHIGFIWKLDDFSPLGGFSYPGEGWALTTDGRRLIMSDGTDQLRFLDPETLAETGRVSVTADGRPLEQINELEWIDGEVWANVWMTDMIVRIDPDSGDIRSTIDLTGLRADAGARGSDSVLNGIAWDAKKKRLFVTGKYWPKLYEIALADCG